MRKLNRIVIIGAGAAGLTTAETVRRLGFGGTIMMVHAEHTPPYDRPPLSKQVLAGTWAPEKVLLRSPAALEKLALDWHHGVQASSLDVKGHRVELSDGKLLEFDIAVIATGLTPRSLASGQDLQGVFALHTLVDALALRHALTAGKQLVVVGGGFLGLEVAATARQLGLEVEVIEPLPVCLQRPARQNHRGTCDASANRPRGAFAQRDRGASSDRQPGRSRHCGRVAGWLNATSRRGARRGWCPTRPWTGSRVVV